MPRHKPRSLPPATHKAPSGMGGIFRVAIVEAPADGKEPKEGSVRCVVNMGNPDWDGYAFVIRRDRLTPIGD